MSILAVFKSSRRQAGVCAAALSCLALAGPVVGARGWLVIHFYSSGQTKAAEISLHKALKTLCAIVWNSLLSSPSCQNKVNDVDDVPSFQRHA